MSATRAANNSSFPPAAPAPTEGAGAPAATRLHLTQRHLGDLRGSGLDDETIRLSGVYSETDPGRISGLLGWDIPAKGVGAALVFPFPDLAGRPTTYARLKLDHPVTHKGAAKPAKYESPRGRGGHVYMPPRARTAVHDASVPLLIVEGEKKSLCGDQHGHAVVGLVGVWGWVRPRDDEAGGAAPGVPRALHPDLEAFALKGRRVFTVFDSDAVYKPGVRHAEWELARALEARGAEVRVARFPARLGGPKVGLDDYAVACGAAALAAVLKSAAPPVALASTFSNLASRPNPSDPAEPIPVPRSLEEMAAELVGAAGGWPRAVGGCLVVPDAAGGVRPIENHHELLAFAGSVFDTRGESRVTWSKAQGAASPQTFHAYLKAQCERFERADPLPHEPPLANVLYTNPAPVPDGTFRALERFLGFFNPASDVDASLLLAALLTPFWGGPPGKRPAFLFEAEENDPEGGRGVGKTTVAQKIAAVCGGAVDIDASEQFARTRSRLLTPDAGSYRVLLMDNVKTFRLSSADLESLITAPNINGHRLYRGQAGVPNYFTLFVTLNGASLSRDVAQRVVPVRLARAAYAGAWEGELDAFLGGSRAQLVADIIATLRSPAGRPPRVSRWGKWEADVLSRVPCADRCAQAIDARTRDMDADQEDGERVREAWAAITERSLGCADPHRHRFLLSSAAVTRLVETALNGRYSAAAASAQLSALGVKGFRKSDRKGLRLWLWEGDECKREGKPATPEVVMYDPEREEWSKHLRGKCEEFVPD